MMLISYLVAIVCVLLSVAFFTLLERKILAAAQIRVGPNLVGIMGLAQPLADALKLFTKEYIFPGKSNKITFMGAPLFMFILAICMWCLYPTSTPSFLLEMGLLLFFCISALNVYGVMMCGWSSNSKYAFLGAMRASAQTISYEVNLLLLLMFGAMIAGSYSWDVAAKYGFLAGVLLLPIVVVWFCTILAETNRAPFDFAEGESELVAGYTIEYGSALFAMIFLAEYASILFMSVTTAVWFFKLSGLLLTLVSAIISVMIIVARAVMPRYRYDLLMLLCWKGFLPFSLGAVGFCLLLNLC